MAEEKRIRAEKIIRAIYNNFSSYFECGDMIIAGSYFYTKLGIPTDPSFKDIDIIINSDKSKDFLIYEIMNFFEKSEFGFKKEDSFISCFDEKNLIGCVIFDECPHIDILRNDFSTNHSNIEILPDIFTDYQSSEKLVEVYEDLIKAFTTLKKKNMVKKYSILKKFYETHDTKEEVERIKSRKNVHRIQSYRQMQS